MSFKVTWVIPILVCALTWGCGSGPAAQQNADVAGAGGVVATSTASPGTKVTIEANLTDANGSISSVEVMVIDSCTGIVSGLLTGSVSRNNLNLTVTYNDLNGGITVALTGTVTGQTISGAYTTTGVCGNDSGTWTAQQMPLISGSYTGNIYDSFGEATPLTANLNADSSYKMTGNVSIPACFNEMTLSGIQVGGGADVEATNVQGDSVGFMLSSPDASFATLTGTYQVTAGNFYCAAGGTATLTKQ
jgi:hypothetical protein